MRHLSHLCIFWFTLSSSEVHTLWFKSHCIIVSCFMFIFLIPRSMKVLQLICVCCISSVHSKMATASSQYEHMELEGVEEGIKLRSTAVRRNLFGPVDHQQLQQDFHKLLCMNLEVAKQRWNFDFQSEHPTPGSVEWEEMCCQEVPAFYHSCVVRTGKRKLEVPISAGGTLAYRGAELEKRTVKYRQAAITGETRAKIC